MSRPKGRRRREPPPLSGQHAKGLNSPSLRLLFRPDPPWADGAVLHRGAPPPDEAAASNAALVRTPPGPRLAQTRPETATSNPGARPGGSTRGINPHRVVPTFTSRTSLVPFPSPGTPDPPTPISSWEVLPHCALLSPGTLAPRCPRGERRPRLGLLCASVATMTVSSRVPSSSSSRVNTRLIPAKPASR